MEKDFQTELTASIRNFSLPKYNEIPNVGLFLEQTSKYISDIIAPLPGIAITGSMISNYVKKKMVANPVKKQYDRDQIAYLLVIAIAKSVLSLEHIQVLFDLQKQVSNSQRAYEYFREMFEGLLFYVFGINETMADDDREPTRERIIMRNTVIAIVHKIYLESSISVIGEMAQEEKQ